MAEEKKTSPKAEKRLTSLQNQLSLRTRSQRKILLNPLRHSSKVLRQRAKRLFGHRQKMSLKTLLLFLL